ncbi:MULTISPECIES: hypothetical protein [Actinoplanes]|uniref:hypothetical protein n=1 Tax=Actinoplanes TaxID=1865 RepID=UPI0005F2EC18|nr:MULTISPECIES: hypothetical protein [Actinoplanes]GLX99815.1 hypothetical protein Acsp01_01950 [Actinoplanes sp. NBRC 101535]
MTEHQDRLREAFDSHENQVPDPAVVYAKIEELSNKYRWRRRGAQVAGGAALSIGLIAGVANLPALFPGNTTPGVSQGIPAAGEGAPAVTPSAGVSTPPTEEETERYLAAYFKAGYDYDAAVELAELWNSKDEIGTVKAEAGRRLLAGENLPVNPATPGGETEEPSADPVDPELDKKYEAFFSAGYTYDSAVALAELWKLDDASDAKIMAGEKLLAGEKLPASVKPDPEAKKEYEESQDAVAFWDAGYDADDAEKLAELWKLDDTYEAKVMAGKKLRAGETLPIQP